MLAFVDCENKNNDYHSVVIVKELDAKEMHPAAEVIRSRVITKLKEMKAYYTFDKLAEMCHISKNHIYLLHEGEKGTNLSLNMAVKVWEGLGGDLNELFIGLTPESFWRVIGLMEEAQRENVLMYADLISSNPEDPQVKALQEMITALHKKTFQHNSDPPKK